MILCFDVGNTDIVLGVFEQDALVRTARFRYMKGLSAWEYLPFIKDKLNLNFIDYHKVEGCVLCCVAQNTTESLSLALETALGVTPFLFSNDEHCGLKVKIGNPQEVGTDIIASCLAVKNNYRLPAIVIDMGTATTLTAMDSVGDLLGVSIITGVFVSLQALRDRTGLPIDESLAPPPAAIGTNTHDSIASGMVLGSAYALDGLIKAFEKQMGYSANLYATGGVSQFIIPLCERDITINNNLLLEGLYSYYKNCIIK